MDLDMDTPELPLTLRPGRLKLTLMLVLSLLFVIAGLMLAWQGRSIGWFAAGLFGLCVPVFAMQFHPRSTYLELTPAGFTMRTLFRAHTLHWGQVQEFRVVMIGLNRMVGWNFAEGDPAAGSRAGAFSLKVSGCEAALPDTYGLKPADLASLLNKLRVRHAGP